MTWSHPVARSVAVAVVLVTAGCLGVITGDEPLAFEADAATVSAAAQDAAGYEEVRRTDRRMTREVSAAGQTREVEVTNRIVEYSRSVGVPGVGEGELARLVVLSTPAVEVLGQTFNPVGDMSNRELAEEVQSQYDGLGTLEPTGERSVTVLDTPTTVSTFSGDAQLGPTGEVVELTLHVTRVRDGGDFIVIIAVHPAQLDGEADRVDSMLGGIRH
jgi:hypothetical protein